MQRTYSCLTLGIALAMLSACGYKPSAQDTTIAVATITSLTTASTTVMTTTSTTSIVALPTTVTPVTTKAPATTIAKKKTTTTVAQLPLSGSPQQMTQQVLSPLGQVADINDFKTWSTKLSQIQASVKSYGMTIVWDPAKKGMDVYQISVGGASACYLRTWADPTGNPAGGFKFVATSCSY